MTTWRKNEATAERRRCTLLVSSLADGAWAPAATDLTGLVFVRLGNASWVVGSGTPTNTGIDGHWIYEATQAETDIDANELEVMVQDATWYALTQVSIEENAGGGASGLVAPQVAAWRYNEPDPDQRKALIRAFDINGAPSLPTIEWSVSIDKGQGIFEPADGVLKPCSAPMDYGFNREIESVDDADDLIESLGHSYETGDGPLWFTAPGGGVLPGGISGALPYYAIAADSDYIRIATSVENALANNYVDITSAGTVGSSPMLITNPNTDFERLVHGHLQYTATQDEAAADSPYLAIRLTAEEHQTSTVIVSIYDLELDEQIIGGYTSAQLQRLMVAVLAGGVLDFTTGNLVFKCPITGVTRLTVVTGPTGRISTTIGNLD